MEVSADPCFRDFVRRRILANIHQGVGRLRANRRPGEELAFYILGDYPLDVPVELVKAVDITPEAASKMEKFEMALKGAIATLKKEGKKITQQLLAQVTGYSQGYISRFRKLLRSLLEDFNSKSNNSSPPTPDAVWVGEVYLPLASPDLLAGEIYSVAKAFPQKDWLFIWEAAPAQTQIDILQRLVCALEADDLLALAAAMEVSG